MDILQIGGPFLFEVLMPHAGHKPYVRYWFPGSTLADCSKMDIYCGKCKEVIAEIYINNKEEKSDGA